MYDSLLGNTETESEVKGDVSGNGVEEDIEKKQLSSYMLINLACSFCHV